MQQRFEAIRQMLDHNPALKIPIVTDVNKLSREIHTVAPDLFQRLQKFQELLKHKAVGGRIDLGADVETIPWESMPKELAACFKPEFGYQPEEITGFGITVEGVTSNGAMSLNIDMQRNGRWWSYVRVGAIVREDYVSGSAYISCQSDQAQPKGARESMRKLNESLWRNDLTGKSDDKRLPQFVHGVLTLRFVDSVLKFAVGELERQVQVRKPRANVK